MRKMSLFVSGSPMSLRASRMCCFEALKSIPVLFILSIVAWSYYAYVVQMCFCKFQILKKNFFDRFLFRFSNGWECFKASYLFNTLSSIVDTLSLVLLSDDVPTISRTTQWSQLLIWIRSKSMCFLFSSSVLCRWIRKWTYCISSNARRTSRGSRSTLSSSKSARSHATFRREYSLLFSMQMCETWSSTSLLSLRSMCTQIWSSLSLVKIFEKLFDLLVIFFVLVLSGQIVVYLMQIINTSFYFLVGRLHFVFTSLW